MAKLTGRAKTAASWVADNRGVLSRVAQACGVSVQFVHMILRGERKSADGRVESELRKRGAPLR